MKLSKAVFGVIMEKGEEEDLMLYVFEFLATREGKRQK